MGLIYGLIKPHNVDLVYGAFPLITKHEVRSKSVKLVIKILLLSRATYLYMD